MGFLDNKKAIVTGGARGIGREIAFTFAQEGADIVLIDVDLQGMEETAKEIENKGRKALKYKADISNYQEVEEFVKWVLDKIDKIDILVNNAGITRDNLIIKMSPDEWQKVIDVNLRGAFNCCKAIIRQMIKQRRGKIINISSIIGIIGNAGQINYSASKAGLIGLTKSLAKEVASRGINVNAIAPGFIKTRMTKDLPQEIKEKMLERIPLARFGTPEDVAHVALFLASDLSNYITGQVIIVDGGMILG